jgi:hypothetical protein
VRFVGFGNTHIVSLKTYAEHLLEKFGVVVLQRRISLWAPRRQPEH